ncbi:hypothetical protein [Imhoffiella purpurea]|uniref:Uncharacterized protein n=1 Tax=Imhoffiella purpurea TaxID=1249627 RepID=W9VG73_9GAMM|nr:hypothetical protein [Imhoffiella purpurea]EXJ15996.1 hypothetical protein D779_0744 [Imhoffiella purpurea]
MKPYRHILLCLWLAVASTHATVTPDCADSCLLGTSGETPICEIWDSSSQSWSTDAFVTGPGAMHNLARDYTRWLHAWMMPAGGVTSTLFADPALDRVREYGGRRDSAIWTGTYLAAEALHFMATGSPDASRWMRETLGTLHRWWNIPGDPGYLARYAAPADSPQPILNLLPAEDPEVHRNVTYAGSTWHWRGNISRDQYQGVLLGYSLAYTATRSPALRETIRSDVVTFVEQLMSSDRREVALRLDGVTLSSTVRIPYAVFSEAEMPSGRPMLTLQTNPFEASGEGVLFFTPDAAELIRQLPGFGRFSSLPLPTQAIQLGAIFRIALQVTDGVPDYAARRQAIAEHYRQHVGEWLDIAADWENSNDCDQGYFGLNIGFMPLYSWIRLETDPAIKTRLQREVLRDALWAEVADHKNVFFAFIYASQAAAGDASRDLIAANAAQLARFPIAPNLAKGRDLRGIYPESEECPGISAVAVDVDERVPATFVWERHPWKLYDAGTPNLVYPGIDYLMAYWMGRYYGFIADDAPGTCLLWRPK